MVLPLFHVDAFTDRPFAGNPAAVCLLPSWKEDRWLQAIAREMNLSETAFLVKQPDHFDLRWFTPKVEVDLSRNRRRGGTPGIWSISSTVARRSAATNERPNLHPRPDTQPRLDQPGDTQCDPNR
jgi:hypothetical protein